MLSRVANSIYWMARYVERAENIARFLEVTINCSLDHPGSGIAQWEPLVRATGDEAYFREHYGEFTPQNVLQFLTFDRQYHSSISTAISRARENARTVREAISSEAWEQLNTLYHEVKEASCAEEDFCNADFYDNTVQQCYKMTGIMEATMSRGTAWHFANIGRFLERADKTSRILDVKYFTLHRRLRDVDTPFDDLLWSAVLRSTCSFEMYRKRYHALTVERIVDFLVLDRKFPRAMRFSVQQVRNSLSEIAGPVEEEHNEVVRQADELLDSFANTTASFIIDHGVHEFTDSLQQSLNVIGEKVHETYFASKAFASVPQQQQ